jgi:hypothetical protein
LTLLIGLSLGAPCFGQSIFNHDLDSDGLPETITINGTAVRITSRASSIVRQYRVSAWNSIQFAALNDRPGDEILFTNLRTINGNPLPSQATVIAYTFNLAKTYDVGSPNQVQLHELNGLPGAEVIFTNLRLINGLSQPAKVAVVNSRSRSLATYDIGSGAHLRFAELDGRPGDEMLFTNLRTINGAARPAQATVIAYAANLAKTYAVGSPNSVRLHELDERPGAEVIFANLWSINGVPQPAQVTVLNSRTRSLATYRVGTGTHLQFVELDGRPGDEMFFTNLRTINGSAQPAQATVIAYTANFTKTYAVGNPNLAQLHDLDGQPGLEALFTNLRLINGVPQAAKAAVLNSRTRSVATYNVGTAARLQFAELDGQPGDEILFTNLRTIIGVALAAQATIVDCRVGIANTFKVGSPHIFILAERNQKPGSEVVFTGRTPNPVIISFYDYLARR